MAGIRNFIRETWYNGVRGVRYYNSGMEVPSAQLWTSRFLESRGIRPSLANSINITSVFGPVRRVCPNRHGLNIFYTGENIHSDTLKAYEELLSSFDLVIGFDYCSNSNYVRFPYWLLHKFDPTSGKEAIIKRVEEIGTRPISPRCRFCSLVSRHDKGGVRTEIADIVEKYGSIEYVGKFRHNSDDLIMNFADNKIEFLRQYKFNICPENSDSIGYVTEKLFDSFESGCIPIYWGSGNNPEPDLINRDAILFLDDTLDSRMNELQDKDAYLEFVSRPVFKENAGQIVWQYFERLENAIKERL